MYSSQIQPINTTYNTQLNADFLFAWKLQIREITMGGRKVKPTDLANSANQIHAAKDYKLTLGNITATYEFRNSNSTIESTPGRDCFFEAVNIKELSRETLIEKLLSNTGSVEVRKGFAHEIRQFLYIGYIAGHVDAAEDTACKKLLRDKIRKLFRDLSGVEERLRKLTIATRSVLGESITVGLMHDELLELLRPKDAELAAQFEEIYNDALAADKQIFEYCCDEEIFKKYVENYLQDACGYIPFARTLGGEQIETTIDIINRLFALNVQVFVENQMDDELYIANKAATGTPIPIYHNGTNHFIGFKPKPKNSNSNSNLSKSTAPAHAQPLLFSVALKTDPTTKTASTYRMSHLLAAGYRGIEYQLLVLLSELTKLLTKDPKYNFEATVEHYDSGNLDDVVIVTKENNQIQAHKAHQVKYYNHPISVYDFFSKSVPENDTHPGKTEKMHIGKFFDGWLTWLKKYPTLEDKQRKSIIYSNADLDPVLHSCVVNDHFDSEFINGKQIILIGRDSKIKTFLNKNFLTHLAGQKVTSHYSTKVWIFLQSNGYVDAEGYFSDNFNPCAPGLELQIPGKVLPRGVTSKTVVETLQAQFKAFTENQTDLCELLYEEAWQYLTDKKLHAKETKQSDKERRVLYRRFLHSFQFQVNQPDLATLEKNIQTDLLKVEQTSTDEVFLYLYYALHEWFRKEYEGEVPILTRETVTALVKDALIRSCDLADLKFRSRAVIDRLSYRCQGQTVERAESQPLRNALGQPGFIMLVGAKGLGKSGLVKQELVKRNPREYLILTAMDLVQKRVLATSLLEVLAKVEAIQIVIIDSAEVLLQMPPNELNALLSALRKLNRTLVLTLTPEGSQHEIFQAPGTVIRLQPLQQEEVIKTFPQLKRYHSMQSLMKLAQIPFYLSQITGLISRMGAQEFNFIVKTREKSLEAELIKLVVEGQEANMVLPRRLCWMQLAVSMARSTTMLNQGAALLSITSATRELVKEGLIQKKDQGYLFDHDLFFEHGLMAFWFQKWETAFVEGRTSVLWRKLSQLLSSKSGTKTILEKWLILHIDQLKEDLLANIDTLSQTTYLDLLFTTALITKKERLVDAVLSTQKLLLNANLRNLAGYHSTTYILLAIEYDCPSGLRKLLMNSAPAHHPSAGELVINGPSVVYELPKPATARIEDIEQLSDHSAESSSSSSSEPESEEDDEEGYSVYYSASDSEWEEPLLESSHNDEEGDFIKEFCSTPKKYWSVDFNHSLQTYDEYEGFHHSTAYKDQLVYDTLYIHQAVLQDRADCLVVLVEHYERKNELHVLNLNSDQQETPLHIGALNNAYASVKLLLAKGALIDLQDRWDETPLHNAAYTGNQLVAQLLLKNGANPNLLNVHGLSPLHVSLTKLDFPMVKLLLEYGADLTLNPFDSFMQGMVVADLLDEVYEFRKEELKEFVLELIAFLNYGYDTDECEWGSRCQKLDKEGRSAQIGQVEELMTLADAHTQISDFFPGFDYYNSETELEYAIENGVYEKIEELQDYILEEPERIDDVLSSDTLSHMKPELLETWFEAASQEQYDTLKEYAELYEDADALARIMEDMAIIEESQEPSSLKIA